MESIKLGDYLLLITRCLVLSVLLYHTTVYLRTATSYESQLEFWACSKNYKQLYRRAWSPCSPWENLKSSFLLETTFDHDFSACMLLAELAEFADRCAARPNPCPDALQPANLYLASNCVFEQVKAGNRDSLEACSNSIMAVQPRAQTYFWMGMLLWERLNITRWVEVIPDSLCCQSTFDEFFEGIADKERVAGSLESTVGSSRI